MALLATQFFIPFLVFSLTFTESVKIYRCKLGKQLQEAGMGETIGDWICLLNYASRYDTAVYNIDHGPPAYSENGLFRINSTYWCNDPNYPGTANGCNVDCSALITDDITASVDCAKIVDQQQGLDAWPAFVNNCNPPGQNNDWATACGL